MHRALIAAVVLSFAGCDNDALRPVAHVACDDFLLQFEEINSDTIEVEGVEGLEYIEVNPGTGDPASIGMIADFNYSGYLTDGERFDSSCPEDRTVQRITLGASQVIPGFELGVLGMQPGGIRRVIVPPHLGYGNDPPAGSDIPPGATLVFDIELVGFPGR